ncbi:MAG: hypothetical protein QXK88_11730 [Desulfurococcaceae archaeon]
MHVDYIEKILSLDEAADSIQGIVDVAKEVNLGIIVVRHGDRWLALNHLSTSTSAKVE